MKTIAIAAIAGYQRFISPYKGFGCAYRVRTGRASCSQFGKRAIDRLGAIAGIRLIARRFQECAESAELLAVTLNHSGAKQPVTLNEACPLWSRWGAKKLSRCCGCWPA